MNLKRALKRIRDEYRFKTRKHIASYECAELAFIAMLDHFFKNAPGTDALFSKRKLNILDVGCSTMPYALALKTFFEKFRQEREVCILGIDTGLGVALAELDLGKSGITGVTVKNKRIEDLKKGGYDLATCFNLCSMDSKRFVRQIYEALGKDGLFLISFDLRDELSFHAQAIRDAGFEIIYKEENKFEPMMANFIFNNRVLCLARKKKR